MDYSRIKRELIEVLRGDFTQLEFSQMLGYHYNQAHKWEADLKKLKYVEFLHICKVVNIDIQIIFSKYFLFRPPYSFVKLYEAVKGRDSKEIVSSKLGVSLPRLERWLKGDSSPEVEIVFKLIDTYSEVLVDLLDDITHPNRVKYWAELSSKRISLKSLFSQFPVTAGIMASLSTEDYLRSSLSNEEYFSKMFDCDVEHIRIIFNSLLKNQIISEDSAVRGKFKRIRDRVDLNGLSFDDMLNIDIFWSERTLNKMKNEIRKDQKVASHSYSAFRIAAMSEQAASEIKELLAQTQDKVLQIIESDTKPKEVVKVYTCHSLDM